MFQECWSTSDTQSAFASALKEQGYTLARGDQRGFVAVDHRGEVFAVSKWAGIKTKEVRSRLSDEQNLPSVDEARIQIAKDMTVRLDALFQEQENAFEARKVQLEEKRQALTRQHKAERQQLRDAQNTLWQRKQQEWRNNLNKGFRGLFDRITGKRRKIEERNEQDAWQVKTDQQQQRDTMIFNQLEIRRSLQSRYTRLQALKFHRLDELENDKSQYQAMRERRLEQLEAQRRETKPQPPTASPAWPGLGMVAI